MVYYVLAVYLGGLIAVPWGFWLVEGPLSKERWIESVVWPLAFPVGTFRRFRKPHGREWASCPHGKSGNETCDACPDWGDAP